MTVLIPIRRSFPRAGVVVIPRKKGVGGILSVLTGGSLNEGSESATGQPWWIPDAYYQVQGKTAPDSIYAANQAADADATQAYTNPITGQVVPAAKAYADSTANAVGTTLKQAQAQPTGSAIADSLSSLLSSLLGTGTDTGANPSGTPTWEIALFVIAAGAGAYLIYKAVK